MSSKAEEQHSDQQEWSVSAYRAQKRTGTVGGEGAVCQLFLVFSLLSLVPTAGQQLCVLLMVKMFSPDPALACWVMETSQLY